MDELGRAFLVILISGMILATGCFVVLTCDRLRRLEARFNKLDAAEDQAVRREKLEAVLGADHHLLSRIIEIFE